MTEELNNPFIIYGYKGEKYFCDREEETLKLIDALHNERNITLIAPRRVGKTGLIKHVFDRIEQADADAKCFYIDIFATKSLEQLVQLMARNIIGRLDTASQGAIRKIQDFFSNLRPTISFDTVTGLPSVSFDIKPKEEMQTLKRIFDYMAQSGYRCYVAIDELQQILNYADSGTEAMLRSYIQFLPNVYFIFSGSVQHLMQEMFTSAKRPFYQSSQIVYLKNVDRTKYRLFANRFFEEQQRTIQDDVFDELYAQVDGITWYVQSILNRVYQYRSEPITVMFVRKVIQEIVDEQETVFQNYYASLTEIQANLLQAIAKEGIVVSPFAHHFISRYQLKAASSVRTALKILQDRQIVYRQQEGYIVDDRFFSKWLRQQ